MWYNRKTNAGLTFLRCQPGIFYLLISLLTVIRNGTACKGSSGSLFFLALNRPAALRGPNTLLVKFFQGLTRLNRPHEYAGRDGAIRPEQWCAQNGQMVQVHRMNGARARGLCIMNAASEDAIHFKEAWKWSITKRSFG